jgi:hypothetical protein
MVIIKNLRIALQMKEDYLFLMFLIHVIGKWMVLLGEYGTLVVHGKLVIRPIIYGV